VDLANFMSAGQLAVNVRLFVGQMCMAERFLRLPTTVSVERTDLLFYFMHMPKTGGSTVRQKAIDNIPAEKRLYVYEDLPEYVCAKDFYSIKDSSTIPLDIVYGHFLHGLHKGKKRKHKYITIVRNPYDLFLSMYFYHKYHTGSDLIANFKDIYDVIENCRIVSFDNYICRAICGEVPENRSVTARDMEKACANIDRDFAFIGLTEALQDSLNIISRVTGMWLNIGRDRLNETVETIERRNLDVLKFRRMVWDRVKFDFAIYEYVKAKFWQDGAAAATLDVLIQKVSETTEPSKDNHRPIKRNIAKLSHAEFHDNLLTEIPESVHGARP